jgi:hypothetical protein
MHEIAGLIRENKDKDRAIRRLESELRNLNALLESKLPMIEAMAANEYQGRSSRGVSPNRNVSVDSRSQFLNAEGDQSHSRIVSRTSSTRQIHGDQKFDMKKAGIEVISLKKENNRLKVQFEGLRDILDKYKGDPNTPVDLANLGSARNLETVGQEPLTELETLRNKLFGIEIDNLNWKNENDLLRNDNDILNEDLIDLKRELQEIKVLTTNASHKKSKRLPTNQSQLDSLSKDKLRD